MRALWWFPHPGLAMRYIHPIRPTTHDDHFHPYTFTVFLQENLVDGLLNSSLHSNFIQLPSPPSCSLHLSRPFDSLSAFFEQFSTNLLRHAHFRNFQSVCRNRVVTPPSMFLGPRLLLCRSVLPPASDQHFRLVLTLTMGLALSPCRMATLVRHFVPLRPRDPPRSTSLQQSTLSSLRRLVRMPRLFALDRLRRTLLLGTLCPLLILGLLQLPLALRVVSEPLRASPGLGTNRKGPNLPLLPLVLRPIPLLHRTGTELRSSWQIPMHLS
jgi:hypothetical protein